MYSQRLASVATAATPSFRTPDMYQLIDRVYTRGVRFALNATDVDVVYDYLEAITDLDSHIRDACKTSPGSSATEACNELLVLWANSTTPVVHEARVLVELLCVLAHNKIVALMHASHFVTDNPTHSIRARTPTVLLAEFDRVMQLFFGVLLRAEDATDEVEETAVDSVARARAFWSSVLLGSTVATSAPEQQQPPTQRGAAAIFMHVLYRQYATWYIRCRCADPHLLTLKCEVTPIATKHTRPFDADQMRRFHRTHNTTLTATMQCVFWACEMWELMLYKSSDAATSPCLAPGALRNYLHLLLQNTMAYFLDMRATYILLRWIKQGEEIVQARNTAMSATLAQNANNARHGVEFGAECLQDIVIVHSVLQKYATDYLLHPSVFWLLRRRRLQYRGRSPAQGLDDNAMEAPTQMDLERQYATCFSGEALTSRAPTSAGAATHKTQVLNAWGTAMLPLWAYDERVRWRTETLNGGDYRLRDIHSPLAIFPCLLSGLPKYYRQYHLPDKWLQDNVRNPMVALARGIRTHECPDIDHVRVDGQDYKERRRQWIMLLFGNVFPG